MIILDVRRRQEIVCTRQGRARCDVQPVHPSSMIPIEIRGVESFTTDIQWEVGVVRRTLWRWRRARMVPQRRRYRDTAVVFTGAEVDAIREYSNRLEPANSPQPHLESEPATTLKRDA